MKGRVTTKAFVKWILFLCVFCFAIGTLFSNRYTLPLHFLFYLFSFPSIFDLYFFLHSFYLTSNLFIRIGFVCVCVCVCADYGIPQLNPTVSSSYLSVDMNKYCKSSMTIPQLTRFLINYYYYYYLYLFYHNSSKLVCPPF
jgi:hypothetical protein